MLPKSSIVGNFLAIGRARGAVKVGHPGNLGPDHQGLS